MGNNYVSYISIRRKVHDKGREGGGEERGRGRERERERGGGGQCLIFMLQQIAISVLHVNYTFTPQSVGFQW